MSYIIIDPNSSVEIEERKFPIYQNFDKIFLKKKKEVHKVKVLVFVESYFIYEFLMPINTEEFTVYSTFRVSQTIKIEKLIVKIPDMSIIKHIKFRESRKVHPTDYPNFNFDLTLFSSENVVI